METKTFSLRTVLTVVTLRLLTVPRSEEDNGIGDLYAILGWMTNDNPFTHQLPRFSDECRPYLLKWYPELGPVRVQKSLDSLDGWIERDKTRRVAQEGIKMWLTELKMMFPEIKNEYDVPRIPKERHQQKDPVRELIEYRESKEGIIVLNTNDLS